MTHRTPLNLATPQQRRLLRLMRERASLKEAAAELEIEYSTALRYLKRLRQRTNARNNADLFYWLGVEDIDEGLLRGRLSPPGGQAPL